ncbi:DUF2815 family protein [Brevibacillus sp. HB2.2]|uniref:DUF2815 family protein n=1 Tax=Brevibacillus sp. HB2.2 TaxID=2738846 RepID=UPI00156A74CC|nr:DUF2815 family protein [Brevibacillus sp. HB2.2]NRS50999.1 DUF2815 family protein [Brevibacillus sp. HB2.2]
MSNQDPKRVVTGKVRLSYVHLFTPRAGLNGGEPKFSVTLLIPKSDVATRQRIDAAIAAAIQEATGTRWNGVRPPMVATPIHDGDGVKADGTPFGEECRGHWVMTASTQADRKPDVVDINLNPIINQSEVYSGIYARVSIRFFGYLSQGKKGIGCGLGNVQKLEDGQPLGGGGASAASDFGILADHAPSVPAYQPPTYPPQGYGAPQQPSVYGQPPAYGQPQGYPQQSYMPPAPPVQQPTGYPPMQQGYGQQPPVAPPTQFDPITGKPFSGGIMGL